MARPIRVNRPHRRHASARGRVSVGLRPSVEELERLLLLATFPVTTAADNGDNSHPLAGSLRAAILAADRQPGADTIDINLGSGAVIRPVSALPQVTDTVTINGHGSALDGSTAGASGGNGLDLRGTSDGSAIRGLTITHFNGAGIFVLTGHNVIGGTDAPSRNVVSGNGDNGITLAGAGAVDNHIEGDYIGTDATGTQPLGNAAKGIWVGGGAANNTVGGIAPGQGNLISANASSGVQFEGAASAFNRVEGNLIGTDRTGTLALGNRGPGVTCSIGAHDNTIGGTTRAARNIISGNLYVGIRLTNDGTANNLVAGNYIGVDITGLRAVGNHGNGVNIDGAPRNLIGGSAAGAGNVISANGGEGVSVQFWNTAPGNTIQGNLIGTDALGRAVLGNAGAGIDTDAPGTTIGGSQPGAGNVVAGSGGDAIDVRGSNTTGSVVSGNFIGTNSLGDSGLENTGHGVLVSGATGIVVGGTALGAGNVISANGLDGVRISGSSGTQVLGNLIGTAPDGISALGNLGAGICIEGSSNNGIGGMSAAAGNVVAYSGGAGVFVASGTGNAILSNQIFSNQGLAIDLAPVGVNPNSPGGPHNGPNDLQNYPVLSTVILKDGGLHVEGTLDGAASTTFTLQFFGNDVADPSGFGQGQVPVGSIGVTTGASGEAPFSATLPLSSPAGQFLSATATDPDGNTSEFAASVRFDDAFYVRNANDNGNDSNPVKDSLRAAIKFVNAHHGGTIRFAINGPGPFTITPVTSLPTINFPTTIDGYSQQGSMPNGTAVGDDAKLSIELNGARARGTGLDIQASHCTIDGLSIVGFTDGIVLEGNGADTSIWGDFVGLTPGGQGDANTGDGVHVKTAGNTIGGPAPADRNVLSGNGGSGLAIDGNTNLVEGNYVGTDPGGTSARTNGFDGINLGSGATGNTIGGTTAGARNVLSANHYSGISLHQDTGNIVEGNSIGVDAHTLKALGNANGIDIHGGSANTIGGTTQGAGNVISGNTSRGILVRDQAAGIVIQGNAIGTDPSGRLHLPNPSGGIKIDGADTTTIGGTAASARDRIAQNGGNGVEIANGTGNVILGDTITRNAGDGVHLASSGNTVGGTASGAGDIIATNGGYGVVVDTGNRDMILRNSIYGNTGGGIHLISKGNGSQLAPALESAEIQVAGMVIRGQLRGSYPRDTVDIELFADPPTAPHGAPPQGLGYLSTITVHTNDLGDAVFVALLPAPAITKIAITATATDATNGTSPFSNGVNLAMIQTPAPASFQPYGPAPIGGNLPPTGRITAIAMDPAKPNIVYVGTAGGGVWKTADALDPKPANIHWTPLTDDVQSLVTGALAYDPNSSTLYDGTGEPNWSEDSKYGHGVFASTNGGAAWSPMTFAKFEHQTISRIVIDPTDPQHIYAAVGVNSDGKPDPSVAGVWEWRGQDKHWTQLNLGTGSVFTPVTDLVVDPHRHNGKLTLYAAWRDLTGNPMGGILKSVDSGKTWARLNTPALTQPGRIALALAPSDDNVLYASVAQNSTGHYLAMLRSPDAGKSWENVTGLPDYMAQNADPSKFAQGNFDQALAVDPQNAKIVYAGGENGPNSIISFAITSEDLSHGTATASPTDLAQWQVGGPHGDHHALVAYVDPTTHHTMLLDGDDGGINRLDTTDSTKHWTSLTGDLAVTQFYGVALNASQDHLAYGASQDNGVEVWTGSPSPASNGAQWTQVRPEDGGAVAASRTDPDHFYFTIVTGDIYSADRTGASTTDLNNGNPTFKYLDGSTPSKGFYSPLAVDPTDAGHLLLGTLEAHVMELADDGHTWKDAGSLDNHDSKNPPSNPGTWSLAFSADGRDVLASNGNVLFARHDGGGFHVLTTAPGQIVDVRYDPTNSKVAYYVVGSQITGTAGHIFRTSDGGTIWVDIGGSGLDGEPTWTVAPDPYDHELFLGGYDGVYASTDYDTAHPHWTRIGGGPSPNHVGGLPDAQVMRLDFNAYLDELAVGTFGRGLWVYDLKSPGKSAAMSSAPAAQPAGKLGADRGQGAILLNRDAAFQRSGTAVARRPPAGLPARERFVDQRPPVVPAVMPSRVATRTELPSGGFGGALVIAAAVATPEARTRIVEPLRPNRPVILPGRAHMVIDAAIESSYGIGTSALRGRQAGRLPTRTGW